MFRAAWDNYIKFYTVFLTFSLGAMGWLLTFTEKNKPSPRIYHVIAIVFIVKSLLTVITSASIARYSSRVGIEYAQTEKDVLGSVPTPPTLLNTQAIPVTMAVWAGWANAVAMTAMIVAWVIVGFCGTN
ncbi:hypothetical protein H7849_17200 [Alloacidobacterium dinghuense]|uniref:Uncharacterized protein n=1 Tax=Alloacidobacterium dinghuense TaxID=2763107 RepID=A0A7G8BE73_9BACT|nr:hypothetical protein [Alloacidobacterium dinghuense]QNI30843.1 hypothetical protein H7849_17200 [Alloacidobacterium dinghuense]